MPEDNNRPLWYKYSEGREVKCVSCDTPIGKNEKRWWNRVSKAVMCDGCMEIKNAETHAEQKKIPDTRERIEKMHDEKMALLKSIFESIKRVAEAEEARNKLLQKEYEKP